MAKKRRGRKSRRNFVVIPFEGELTLGALAANVVVLDDAMDGNFTHDFYAISADVFGQMTGLTAGEGDPSILGFAHGDYTVAEIAEQLVVKMLGPGQKVEQERARRIVRKTGTFHGKGLGTHTEMNLYGREGSGDIRTTLKFMIQKDRSLSIWVQNRSNATLTTGAVFRFSGNLYGRWVY